MRLPGDHESGSHRERPATLVHRWKAALNAFEITFDGRLSAGCDGSSGTHRRVRPTPHPGPNRDLRFSKIMLFDSQQRHPQYGYKYLSILVLPNVFGLTYGRSRNSATPAS